MGKKEEIQKLKKKKKELDKKMKDSIVKYYGGNTDPLSPEQLSNLQKETEMIKKELSSINERLDDIM